MPLFSPHLLQSAVNVSAIDLSVADAALPEGTFGIYVGGAGNVAVKGRDGVSATFTAVPVGSVLRFCGPTILKTGTTATSLLALKV